jgi:hypothetical protein
MLAFLIWNPDYSNPTRLRWNDTVRQYPVYIGVQPETYDTVISIMQQVHFEATTAHLPSLNWCGYTFHYRFAAISADNSMQQKAMGSKGGSAAQRCPYCPVNFNIVSQCWHFSSIAQISP